MTQKRKRWEKPKTLQHFKADTVLKIDEPFYKQAESK